MGSKIALALCVIGFLLAAFLTHLHFYPELRTPLCTLSSDGCQRALESPYAVWHGVPLSVLGLCFYATFALLLLCSSSQVPLRLMAAAGLVTSVVLVALQAFSVGAFCPLCCGSAACCVALAGLVFANRVAPMTDPRRWAAVALAAVILGRFSFAILERPRVLEHADYSLGQRLGPADAPFKVLTFGDFECTYCRAVFPSLLQLQRENPQRVALYFRDFPLPSHPHAIGAARAAQAAAIQGHFWDYAQLLELKGQSLDDAGLTNCARRLGLDVARWDRDRQGAVVTAALEKEQADAARSRIVAAPAVFINGTQVIADAKLLERARARLR